MVVESGDPSINGKRTSMKLRSEPNLGVGHNSYTPGTLTKSYWKLSFIVDLPLKHVDFPVRKLLVYQAGYTSLLTLKLQFFTAEHPQGNAVAVAGPRVIRLFITPYICNSFCL